QQKILVEWNNTAADYPTDKCIHELFEEQVERTPDAIAVVYEDEQLTYRELNQRANRLAHYLQTMGVGPEVIVGICIERSIEMVVGLLGILKAGAAYLPIDPAYSPKRIAFILENAQSPVVLTVAQLAEGSLSKVPHMICLDTGWPAIASMDEQNPISKVTPENLAYVIYTSGSTGEPKGVMISHRAICNHMFWMQERFPLDQSDRVLQKT